jgi:DNA polymerase-3 subunit epsilon
MRILVIDTETTGLLPRSSAPNIAEYPFIVQLSLRTYDTSTGKQTGQDIIIRPVVSIPGASTSIHGITDDIAREKGVPAKDALLLLALALDDTDVLVGHNLEFDTRVLQVELERNGLVNIIRRPKLETYCTMLHGKSMCRIIAKDARTGHPYVKYPKLGELYKHLFSAEVDGLHNAHADTAATMRCYLKMACAITHAPQDLHIREKF